jgi:hypothetical protein
MGCILTLYVPSSDKPEWQQLDFETGHGVAKSCTQAIYIYMYIYVYMYIYTYIHTTIYICIYIAAYIYIYIYTCICRPIFVYLHGALVAKTR